MRIVLTTNFSPWSSYSGGGQRSTHQLATALSNLGHEVIVVYTKTPREAVSVPDELSYEIRWATFVGLSSTRAAPLRPLNALSVRQVVKRIHEERAVDVVHSQGEEGALLHGLRSEKPFRLIVTPRYPWYPKRLRPHSNLLDQARLWLFDAKYPVLGRLVRDADMVCPTSQAAAEGVMEAFGVNEERIKVVPNGINPLFWQENWSGNVTDAHRDVVFYGRLDHDKGLDVLLDALSKQPNVRLHVIGRGDLEERLKHQSVELGLNDRIRWTPWCSPTDLVALLKEARLAVLPSRHESFGNVMAESLAVGTPLVTCKAGSIPEVVGAHAWLAEPNDVNDLKRMMALAMSNQRNAVLKAKAGRKHVAAQYHWEKVADTFLSIYVQTKS